MEMFLISMSNNKKIKRKQRNLESLQPPTPFRKRVEDYVSLGRLALRQYIVVIGWNLGYIGGHVDRVSFDRNINVLAMVAFFEVKSSRLFMMKGLPTEKALVTRWIMRSTQMLNHVRLGLEHFVASRTFLHPRQVLHSVHQ